MKNISNYIRQNDNVEKCLRVKWHGERPSHGF